MQRTASDPLQRMLQSAGWIYLIREREFIRTGDHVYKLGKTAQDGFKRAAQYPNDSMIEIHLRVIDHNVVERELIKTFRSRFIWRKDLGSEYFQGSRNEMIKEIVKYAEVIENEEPERPSVQMQERKVPEPSAPNWPIAATEDSQYSPMRDDSPPRPAYVDILLPPDEIPRALSLNRQAASHQSKSMIDAFSHIFSVISSVIAQHFNDDVLGSLHRDHKLDWILQTSGNPYLIGEEIKAISVAGPINLDKFIADLEKLFGGPTSRKLITCEQYTRFTAINNCFAGLTANVAAYNIARQKTSTPERLIGVKFTKKMNRIVPPIYLLVLKKCSDYIHVGQMYETFAKQA